MRVDPEHSSLELCNDSGHVFWRAKNSLATGLQAELWGESEPVVRVFTGGYCSTNYVPAGTHVPLQVQATFAVLDGNVTPIKVSVTYQFGDKKNAVPAELAAVVERDAITLVEAVITLSPSFPKLWDQKAASTTRTLRTNLAEELEARRNRVADELAAAITHVLSETSSTYGTLAPQVKTLARDARIFELADMVLPTVQDENRAIGSAVVTERTLSRLANDACKRLEAHERLSEPEFIALVLTDQVKPGMSDAEIATIRAAVQATYDHMYDVNYDNGFPDRAANEVSA